MGIWTRGGRGGISRVTQFQNDAVFFTGTTRARAHAFFGNPVTMSETLSGYLPNGVFSLGVGVACGSACRADGGGKPEVRGPEKFLGGYI